MVIVGEMNKEILQQNLGLKHRQHFIKSYLNPAIKEGYIELTVPDKPKSVLQKYRLTEKGLKLKQELENKNNK